MKRAVLLALIPALANGSDDAPPWVDEGDVPIPTWAQSLAPKKDDLKVLAAPGRIDRTRGALRADGVRLPIYAAKRAGNCTGKWFSIGPASWVCSDGFELSGDPPGAIARPPGADGLPFRYFFAGKNGASGFLGVRQIEDDTPDFELEPGFAVAVASEQVLGGERFVRTRRGAFLRARDLGAAKPSAFRGESVTAGKLDFGWILPARATVFDGVTTRRATGLRVRFERVLAREERAGMVRISEDRATPEWVSAKDLARPERAAPPPEAGPKERWVDVILASQTIVAYEGAEPVYASLVSTGTGAQGTDTATPKGTHRIWVKLETSDMDNLENEDVEKHYSIEDVPYVQFFDKAVGLHAAFWHEGFGRVRSHGCVNLAPLDAAWFFRFTAPHVPSGWSAALPSAVEPGTLVRVR